MDTINDGRPAFPLAGDGDNRKTERGMSLRTYLAGQAMQGMISKHEALSKVTRDEVEEIAKRHAKGAVVYADALIAALNERGA